MFLARRLSIERTARFSMPGSKIAEVIWGRYSISLNIDISYNEEKSKQRQIPLLFGPGRADFHFVRKNLAGDRSGLPPFNFPRVVDALRWCLRTRNQSGVAWYFAKPGHSSEFCSCNFSLHQTRTVILLLPCLALGHWIPQARLVNPSRRMTLFSLGLILVVITLGAEPVFGQCSDNNCAVCPTSKDTCTKVRTSKRNHCVAGQWRLLMLSSQIILLIVLRNLAHASCSVTMDMAWLPASALHAQVHIVLVATEIRILALR